MKNAILWFSKWLKAYKKLTVSFLTSFWKLCFLVNIIYKRNSCVITFESKKCTWNNFAPKFRSIAQFENRSKLLVIYQGNFRMVAPNLKVTKNFLRNINTRANALKSPVAGLRWYFRFRKLDFYNKLILSYIFRLERNHTVPINYRL